MKHDIPMTNYILRLNIFTLLTNYHRDDLIARMGPGCYMKYVMYVSINRTRMEWQQRFSILFQTGIMIGRARSANDDNIFRLNLSMEETNTCLCYS